MTTIGLLDVAPGFSAQRGHLFLATDLTAGEPHREPEEQDMRMGWFSRTEVEKMMAAGMITDAQSVAAYLLLLLRERS
jgi:hypothetical protein